LLVDAGAAGPPLVAGAPTGAVLPELASFFESHPTSPIGIQGLQPNSRTRRSANLRGGSSAPLLFPGSVASESSITEVGARCVTTGFVMLGLLAPNGNGEWGTPCALEIGAAIGARSIPVSNAVLRGRAGGCTTTGDGDPEMWPASYDRPRHAPTPGSGCDRSLHAASRSMMKPRVAVGPAALLSAAQLTSLTTAQTAQCRILLPRSTP
jgi:hypothetical protein